MSLKKVLLLSVLALGGISFSSSLVQAQSVCTTDTYGYDNYGRIPCEDIDFNCDGSVEAIVCEGFTCYNDEYSDVGCFPSPE